MRFLKNGPNIPDDLINSTLEGETTFLCGAGVSMSVGLPDFKQLTVQLYEKIGEDLNNVKFEKREFRRRQYDRVIGSLEKRTRSTEEPFLVRKLVGEILTNKKSVPLDNHECFLRLSQNPNGQTRILTTNFDTLFEKAAMNLDPDTLSYATKEIPMAGGKKDFGIMHIHGRISDESLNLEESDLILTSSDFGAAYLRDGWITRYIEDRMRLGPIILVGYGAEDSAMRLLLDTIDTDRERFTDLKNIYAMDRKGRNTLETWRTRGITPILFEDFSDIYENVKEWAKYNSDPFMYGQERTWKTLSRKSTTKKNETREQNQETLGDSDDFELEQIRFFLKKVDFSAILYEYIPSLHWLPKLIGKENTVISKKSLSTWISLSLNDLNAYRDFLTHLNELRPDFAEILETELKKQTDLKPKLKNNWQLLILHIRNNIRIYFSNLNREHDLKTRLNQKETSYDLMEELADLLRPKLSITRQTNSKVDDDGLLEEILTGRFEIGFYNEISGIFGELTSWLKNLELRVYKQMLTLLESELLLSLEEVEIARASSNKEFIVYESKVSSMEQIKSNVKQSGFLPILHIMYEIWCHISEKNKKYAKNIVDSWIHSPHNLLKRLAFFVSCSSIIPISKVNRYLMEAPTDELIRSNEILELLKLISNRWKGFSKLQRQDLEKQILSKASKQFTLETKLTNSDLQSHESSKNQKTEEISLVEQTQRYLEELNKKSENDETDFSAYTSSSFSSENSIEIQTKQLEKLKGISDKKLISSVWHLKDMDPANVWETVCEKDNAWAFRGLKFGTTNKANLIGAWNLYLRAKPDQIPNDQVEKVMQYLLKMSKIEFDKVAGSAAFWLNTNFHFIEFTTTIKFWDRIFTSNACKVRYDIHLDIPEIYLHHPYGQLAELLINLSRQLEGINNRKREKIELRMNQLLDLPDAYGVNTKLLLAHYLETIFQTIPEWTESKMLPLFNWSNPLAAKLWSTRMYISKLEPVELFEKIKKPYLQLFNRDDIGHGVIQEFIGKLVDMLFLNLHNPTKYPLEYKEVRTALRNSSDKSLFYAGIIFVTEMDRVNSEGKKLLWKKKLKPVFNAIWPMDNELQTTSSTYHLVRLLCASGEAFPDVATTIIQHLRQVEPRDNGTFELLLSEGNSLFESSPSKMLHIVEKLVGDGPIKNFDVIRRILNRLGYFDSNLTSDKKFHRLMGKLGNS